MSGDLISRRRFAQLIRDMKRGAEQFESQAYRTGSISTLSAIEGALAIEPAIDAEIVRHAHWMLNVRGEVTMEPTYIYTEGYKCSYCGRVAKKREPYCHCGAKMDEEA